MARIERSISRGAYLQKALATAPSVATCARTFRNWWRLTQVFSGRAAFTPPLIAVGRKGYKLPLHEPGDVETLWDVFCLKSYRPPQGCGTVVDVGANIGAFALYALYEAGARQVYAIEPVERSYHQLKMNVALNDLGGRVALVHKGIGGQSGPRTIALGAASKNACMYKTGAEAAAGASETIEVVTLEQLLDDLKLAAVDFLKLDCEGAEVEALMAASDSTLRRCRTIGMEYHFYQGIADEASLFARLSGAGFRCVRHNRAKRLATFSQA